VSKALHFKHEVPVTVRFSANTGMPKIADADPRASPRGLGARPRNVNRANCSHGLAWMVEALRRHGEPGR